MVLRESFGGDVHAAVIARRLACVTGDTVQRAAVEELLHALLLVADQPRFTHAHASGDRIADPTLKAGAVYKTFAGNPLFASGGPSLNDIRQGGIADCWLLAELGAEVFTGTPEDYGHYLAGEIARWAKVIQFSGAKAE